MGYYSYLSGRIDLTPPLTWNEFKDSRLRDNRISIMLVESVQTTDEGTTTMAVAVVSRWEDEAKHWDLEENLEEVARLAPGRTFSGNLIRCGENQGDAERYWITERGVESEKARLVWPDGETVNPDDL